jgi:hypothetical protein
MKKAAKPKAAQTPAAAPAEGPISAAIRAEIERRGGTSYALAKAAGLVNPVTKRVSADIVDRFRKRERGLSLESAEQLAASLGLVMVRREAD